MTTLRRGFTLVEVVIAVGIFAGSIAVVLSLLPSLARQSADSVDRLVAQRMSDALQIELQRQIALVGFDAFASTVPVMNVPLSNGLDLVATSNGLRIEPVSGSGGGGTPDDEHFLVEAWRFSQAPLAYDASAATLPLYVRISWPYRLPGGADPTAFRDRDEFTVVLALDR